MLCNVYLSFVAYSLLLKEYIRIVSPHVQWSMQCKFIQHFNHVLLSASTSLLVFISSTYFSWSDLTFVFALFQRDQGKLSGVVSITPLIWFQWNEPSTIFIWCQWLMCAGIGIFSFDNMVFFLGDDLLQSPSIVEDSNICTLALFRSFILSVYISQNAVTCFYLEATFINQSDVLYICWVVINFILS